MHKQNYAWHRTATAPLPESMHFKVYHHHTQLMHIRFNCSILLVLALLLLLSVRWERRLLYLQKRENLCVIIMNKHIYPIWFCAQAEHSLHFLVCLCVCHFVCCFSFTHMLYGIFGSRFCGFGMQGVSSCRANVNKLTHFKQTIRTRFDPLAHSH